MSIILLAGWLLAGHGLPADTTLELRRGDRVTIENLGGTIRVEAWSRSTLEIRQSDGESSDISAARAGSRVTVSTGPRRRRGMDVDAVVRLPAWVDLEIQGRSVDVWIAGMEGAVAVRNLSGNLHVERISGDVRLATVEGEIEAREIRGAVSARSQGEGIRLVDVVGSIDVSTGSGDLRLEGIRSASVLAETLDGDVLFAGTLQRGGTYRFSVHDGDATLELPRSTAADVRVATFDGEFVSDFPVLLQRFGGGGVMEFTLGDGGADLEIEVFDGEIRLREARAR
jgi:hypothetical protein